MSDEPLRLVDLLVTGAAEVLTCAGDAPDLIGRVAGGGVAVDGGRIVAVGDVSRYAGRRVLDAADRVVMPGFVDAHTHVVFGGTRVQEYAARVAGLEPPPGAPAGILGTTLATRACATPELVEQAGPRILEMLAHGTTTLESKSGYGLDTATELRILEAGRTLAADLPVDIMSTYLGAHAFPPGVEHAAYVDRVVDLIPAIAETGLARFCDVYCDEGYFDLARTRRILEAGIAHGLKPKLHLDAYSHTGAARLAAELGATSVDHLNLTTMGELEALGAAGVVGVYLPCLDFAVAHPAPLDPRRILDAGMELALATDICPGCWTTSMQLAVVMACRHGGLSVPQALRAATYGAARALGCDTVTGSLEPGKRADLIILDVARHEDIAYRIGRNSVTTVVSAGTVVVG
ncbi:imidazolonepropionase [Streptomyces sp. NBC_01669]|uniref:imidazolonepropionase n=1 Tax=Streptomyces sp. NBC_01669 TaxID=2975909 RepID=UPI002254216D|nr:imidazolonepropionase [Streptomyces sp. NBC_01669]MCX4538943.1 imidazolonepropionase [Streptomyces sp. NBC_01669]